ncbi:hypothetical protein [Gottfriedia acidiceleris]|uniref:hypothetical protein n=1 Tax=Gottfriedia acidiceleris TaxID=371036 RepID=UPI003000730C
MKSNILKADFVLFSTFENSHDASKHGAKICNEFYIPLPCTSTTADGLTGVLMDAAKLIKS